MSKSKDLAAKFTQLIDSKNWFSVHDSVVVAVSAGVDSMALLNLMINLPDSCRPNIIVAHVNHQLREQSREEEAYVRDFCKNHQLQLFVKKWPKEMHPKQGMENAARKFRYDFFAAVMKKTNAKFLITAHHGNDQAETVLMKLIRGSFIKHISGIQSSRKFADGYLVRPLLSFSKANLRKYAKRNHIKWYEDETNHQLDVFRNRIRNRILPMLSNENSQVVEHIDEFSEQLSRMNRQNEYFFYQLMDKLKDDDENLELSQWQQLPHDIQWGVIEYLLVDYLGDNFNESLVQEIIRLLTNEKKPQGNVELSNNFYFIKSYKHFSVKKLSQNSTSVLKNQNFVVTLNKWFLTAQKHYFMITDQESDAVTDYNRKSIFYLSDDDFPLVVQNTKNRDKITLKNGGHQTAKRLFINSKVPINDRLQAQTLMTNKSKVLAILGYSESVSTVRKHTKKYVLIIK